MAKISAMVLVIFFVFSFQLAESVDMEESTFFEDQPPILENPIPSRVPPDFFCNSCRKVSMKVEKFLTEPILNKQIESISAGFCNIVHTELQFKCKKLMELYLREGILFFQLVFLEKNLCNYTGFCPPNNNNTGSFTEQPLEVIGSAVCDACHAAAEEIRKGLIDHDQQMSILKALFEACEKLQAHADQCKRSVFQYGPLVIGNLHKFLAGNDLCAFLKMCDWPTPAPPPEANFPATTR